MYYWTPLEWLYTLLSGPALLTLHELYVCPDESRWLAAVVLVCTGLVGGGIAWVAPRDYGTPASWFFVLVDLSSLAVQITANAALLLRKGSMLDPDVGAGLMLIPLAALMSMQWGSYHAYDHGSKLILGALTITVFICAGAAALAGLAEADASYTETPFSWVFLATNALFSCTEPGSPPMGVLSQALIWTCLAFTRSLLELLLVSVVPHGLFVFQAALLALACVSLAARVHHTLSCMQVQHPKRVLMLFNASVISFAYSFHWRHPHQIALAAIFTLLLRAGAATLQSCAG